MDINSLTAKYELSDNEAKELEGYIANRFEGIEPHKCETFEFIGVWKKLAALGGIIGAAEVINKKLTAKLPIDFKNPDGIKLEIYDSLAGEIPIIYADDPQDFESLVVNIVYKGRRPENIGQTGASFISGNTTRLIILSSKPYSNVPACELSLDEKDWARRSMLIRRSHECTHYYTKQAFGISNNILHDELMADFIGLYDTFGFYKAEWFLRFMGVIEGSGGRMAVYTSGLSVSVTNAVAELLTAAAYGLEKWSESEQFSVLSQAGRINEMCRLGITGMDGLVN